MRTLNGKDLGQIQTEFMADFPMADFKQQPDGTWYLPVEKYEERLNAVCGGSLFYTRTSSECTLHSILGKHTFSVNCRLVIYADDGSVLVEKSANGGENVVILDAGTDKERALNIKRDISAAESDAFKQVCNSLGIAIGQLRRLNAEHFGRKKKQEKGTPVPAQAAQTSEKVEKGRLDFSCGLEHIGSGRSERYQSMVFLNGKEYRFFVFHDEIKEFLSRETGEALSNGEVVRSISCCFIKKSFRGEEQLIFRRW